MNFERLRPAQTITIFQTIFAPIVLSVILGIRRSLKSFDFRPSVFALLPITYRRLLDAPACASFVLVKNYCCVLPFTFARQQNRRNWFVITNDQGNCSQVLEENDMLSREKIRALLGTNM